MSLYDAEKNKFYSGCTDIGLQRKLNEDSYHIDPSLGLILVADGMGGHNAGEVASRKVVKLIQQSIAQRHTMDQTPVDKTYPNENESESTRTWNGLVNSEVEIVKRAVLHANTVLYNLNKDNGYADNQGMGTTIVGAWIQYPQDKVIIFHVGDSRAYIYRSKRMTQMTKDHSLYQEWLDYGRIGPMPPQNIILQAIGLIPQVTIDIKVQSLKKGDVILLCTDGLTSMVNDQNINKYLNYISIKSVETLCHHLVQQANQNGGTDNITVALTQYN